MNSFKPRRAFIAAVLSVALGTFAFACGSNDEWPGACQGTSCAEGGANEGSSHDGPLGPDTASADAAEAGGDADAGLDANVDADAAHPPYTGNHIWSKLFGSNASSSVSGLVSQRTARATYSSSAH